MLRISAPALIALVTAMVERVGSAVWVRLGEPIDATEWFAQSTEENERRRMRELTQEIDRRLKGLVIHLGEEKWEPLVDDLELLVPVPLESGRNPFALLRWRTRIADAMTRFITRYTHSADEVIAFAERQGVAPGIVVGQLQHRKVLQFSRMNELKARFKWEDS